VDAWTGGSKSLQRQEEVNTFPPAQTPWKETSKVMFFFNLEDGQQKKSNRVNLL
jgi:hypothetical protein